MVLKLRYYCATCGDPFDAPKTWAYCSKACETNRGGWAARQDRDDVADRMCEPVFEERLRLGVLLEHCAPWERDGLLAKIRETEHQEAAVRSRVQEAMPVHTESRPAVYASHPIESAEHWAPIVRRESDRFELTMRRGLEQAIRLGKRLIEAKEKAGHGEFGRLFRDHELAVPNALPFHVTWARRLMAIAGNEVLTNPDVIPKLPAEISTVYVLSRCPVEQLREAIVSGAVQPALRYDEARRLLPQPEQSEDESIDAEMEAQLGALLDPIRIRIAAFACDRPSLMGEVRSRLKAMLRAIESVVDGSAGSPGTELMGGAEGACMGS